MSKALLEIIGQYDHAQRTRIEELEAHAEYLQHKVDELTQLAMAGTQASDKLKFDLIMSGMLRNKPTKQDIAVMRRLRAPFGCEFILGAGSKGASRWRIHDANDDAIASVSEHEEGYARLIVQALNTLFEIRKAKT